MGWNYYGFAPYVSVAERRRNAQREVSKLQKKGKKIQPIIIEGRTIARSFWGKAWCDNLEAYSDYENRIPRGRTYVRNGSVVHLEIRAGAIEALVSGSSLYKVAIQITPVVKTKWTTLCRDCSGGIGSLIELLQGRFSDRVMEIITRKETGLFPAPREIEMSCSCPDSAGMCKHIAAVLYGVGARLDHSPELMFLLRSANHEELITQAASASELAAQATGAAEMSDSEITSVFGIELDTQSEVKPARKPPVKARKAAAKPAKSTAKPTKPKSRALPKKKRIAAGASPAGNASATRKSPRRIASPAASGASDSLA